jgi:chemotaxis protein MotB
VHRIRSIGLLIALSAFGAACHPTEEEYKAKQAEVDQLKAKLGESEQRANSLEARLKEVSDNNAALAEKLNLAGAEKGTLERALEELRAREKQSQARLAVFTEMLNKFRAMIDSGKLRVRVVRGRMVVELAENILFDSGRADLKKEGQEALTQVASVLSTIENRDFQVAGHTDNIPIKSARFPSNWELSTNRAVVVTKWLTEKGLDANRVSAAGYADTWPVAPNDTPDGRQQNRRIEIVLMPNLDELPDLSSLAGK